MPSNFPNNPSVGTTHTIGDITWEWNGVAWIAVGGIGVTFSLNDLTDVSIVSPTPEEVLKYDGSEWRNNANLDGGSF